MNRRSFLALALIPNIALAHSYKQGNILIGHAWGAPSNNDETQIFMPLFNGGDITDILISVSCDLSKSSELRLNNDYATPPQVGFSLEPKKPVPMRPTARHIRLLGLSKPLLAGDTISISLRFERSGETKIDAHIQDKASE